MMQKGMIFMIALCFSLWLIGFLCVTVWQPEAWYARHVTPTPLTPRWFTWQCHYHNTDYSTTCRKQFYLAR